MAQIGLGLGDFVGVVGEGVVDAAAVDVQIFTQVIHADGGALDVPARVSYAPGAVPLQFLIVEFGFGEPEHEVGLVPLAGIFFHAFTDAYLQILRLEIVEYVVFLQFGGVKVHVAAGDIGVIFFQQILDHLNEIADAVCRRYHDVGALHVQLVAIRKECVGVEAGDLHNGLFLPLGTLQHLIFTGVRVAGQMTHVRDVHSTGYVVSRVAEIFFQHVLHNVGAEVADVGEMIDRGTAGVHLHLAGLVGNKVFFLVGEGIIQLHILILSGSFLFFFRDGAEGHKQTEDQQRQRGDQHCHHQ